MSEGMIFGLGVSIGFIITSILFLLICKCEHVWEQTGVDTVYPEGTKCTTEQFPLYRVDLYKCKKCKKNKRERQ